MAQSIPLAANERAENPSQPPSQTSPAAWSQIFSQHELYLNRHLEICSKAQQHVPPKGDSFRVISSIIEGTQKLLGDMEKLRKEFTSESSATRILSGKVMDKVDQQRAALDGTKGKEQRTTPPPPDVNNNPGSAPAQSPLFFFDKNPATHANTLPRRSNTARKRSREEDNGATMNWKRTKIDTPHEGGKEIDNNTNGTGDKPFTPTVELDDISEEVEARLKLKEESRKRRKAKPQRKRKRDSSGSAEGNQGDNGNPRRSKRAKRGGGGNGGGGEGGRTGNGAPHKRKGINEAARSENGQHRPKRHKKA